MAVTDTLSDWFAVSDKIDEIHEQLDGFFVLPLPEFPYDDEEISGDSFAYFRWLGEILANRAPEKGGYALLMAELGEEEITTIVVNRVDVDRIIALAELLDVEIQRATVGYSY